MEAKMKFLEAQMEEAELKDTEKNQKIGNKRKRGDDSMHANVIGNADDFNEEDDEEDDEEEENDHEEEKKEQKRD